MTGTRCTMDESPPNPDAAEHRQRLFTGMARAVTTKGYSDSTIADIVREAGVSRRTFYENFTTKADCLIALYEFSSRNALNALRSSLDPERSWQTQVEDAMVAYLNCLENNPLVMRTLFVEILGLGTPGLAARRRVNQEIADFMCKVINASEGRDVLAPDMAMAVVGGVNELALQRIERDQLQDLRQVSVTAGALLRAVVGGTGTPIT
jgi:AcrR family transcriptional regulator